MEEIKEAFIELKNSLKKDFGMNEEEAKDTALYLMQIYGLC